MQKILEAYGVVDNILLEDLTNKRRNIKTPELLTKTETAFPDKRKSSVFL